MFRRNKAKDRANEYVRANRTTPLSIGIRATAWMTSDDYEVGGRMTVTNRRLLFEPSVFMMGELPEEIHLDQVPEVVDANSFAVIVKHRTGIATTSDDECLFLIENNRDDKKVMALLEKWVRHARQDSGSLGEEFLSTHTDSTEGKKGVNDLILDFSDRIRGAGEKVDQRISPEAAEEIEEVGSREDNEPYTNSFLDLAADMAVFLRNPEKLPQDSYQLEQVINRLELLKMAARTLPRVFSEDEKGIDNIESSVDILLGFARSRRRLFEP